MALTPQHIKLASLTTYYAIKLYKKHIANKKHLSKNEITPKTLEDWLYLASLYDELVEEQRAEINRLKIKNNKLIQKQERSTQIISKLNKELKIHKSGNPTWTTPKQIKPSQKQK